MEIQIFSGVTVGRKMLFMEQSFLPGQTSTEGKDSFYHCLPHHSIPILHIIFILCYTCIIISITRLFFWERFLNFQPFSLIDSFKHYWVRSLAYRVECNLLPTQEEHILGLQAEQTNGCTTVFSVLQSDKYSDWRKTCGVYTLALHVVCFTFCFVFLLLFCRQ